MGVRVVTLDGVWRVFGDTKLKMALNQLVQHHAIKSGTSPGAIYQELLAHPYLTFDPWSAAEEQHNAIRSRLCRNTINDVIAKLSRGELTFLGLEDSTEGATLTASKLSDRVIQCVELSDRWFLLRIERHPFGGTGQVLIQYWLYSKPGRTLRLLKNIDHLSDIILTGAPKVQKHDGTWEDVSAKLEDSFHRLLMDHFGAAAVDQFKRLVHPQDHVLFAPPLEVLRECEAQTGIDYGAEQAAQRNVRERTYLKKFGPPQDRGPQGLGWALDAGIQAG